MRYSWAVYAIVVVFAIAIPLFPLASRYLLFLHDLNQLPLPPAHPHVQHSVSSANAALAATACAFLPMPVIVVLCPAAAIRHGGAILDDITSSQRDLYTDVARLLTHNELVALFTSVAQAAEYALAVDDFILLAEDGELEVRGIGNVALAVEIHKESVAAALAVRGVLLHAELSASLIMHVHGIYLAGLDSLKLLGSYGRRWTTRSSHRFFNISSDTASTSIDCLKNEVQSAVAITSRLVAIVRRFVVERETYAPCPRPLAPESCAKLLPLFRGDIALESALGQLLELQELLSDGMEDDSWVGVKIPDYTLAHTLWGNTVLVGAHVDAMKDLVIELQVAREAGEAAMRLAHLVR